MYRIVRYKNTTILNKFKRVEIRTKIDIEFPIEFNTYTDATSHIEFKLKGKYLPKKEFSKVYFTEKENAVWFDGVYFYSVFTN